MLNQPEVRCRGECCKCFPMSVTLQDLKDSLLPDPKTTYSDAAYVVDMLIPLGKLTDSEVRERFGLTRLIKDRDEPYERFTCRHLRENGDCGAYETRPQMCRSYPEEHMKSCLWKECQASCSLIQMAKAIAEKKGAEVGHG